MADPIMSPEGRSVIVTGAAQGIGRGVAELELELGANVTAVDLNGEALEAFRDQASKDRLLPQVGSVPGSIVNVSSDAGRKGTIGQINYGAAKAGLLGLTMSAAREWGRGIRVNTAVFGIVVTPMTETIRGEKFKDQMLAQIPLGRWAEAEEVARPVCFLLSDAGSYITGQHISVNGGFTINV